MPTLKSLGVNVLPPIVRTAQNAKAGGQVSSTNLVLNVSGAAAGQLAVLFGFYASSTSTPALSQSGWTQHYNVLFASSPRLSIWSKILTAADLSSGVTLTGSTFNLSACVVMFTGARYGRADGTGNTSGNVTNFTPLIKRGQKVVWAVALRADSGTVNCDRGTQIADTGSGLRHPSKLYIEDDPPLGVFSGVVSSVAPNERYAVAVRMEPA